jgi:hypothetical protein
MADVQLSDLGSVIKTAYEGEANTNAFTDAEKTKLTGIETGATADQTAGEIKTAYESNADTNAFTDGEQSKLTSIESGAQVNPSASEIKTAYESNADTNAFTDAEKTKLTGIETGATADQTGAEIVTAIDTELGSNIWRGRLAGIRFPRPGLYASNLIGGAASTNQSMLENRFTATAFFVEIPIQISRLGFRVSTGDPAVTARAGLYQAPGFDPTADLTLLAATSYLDCSSPAGLDEEITPVILYPGIMYVVGLQPTGGNVLVNGIAPTADEFVTSFGMTSLTQTSSAFMIRQNTIDPAVALPNPMTGQIIATGTSPHMNMLVDSWP